MHIIIVVGLLTLNAFNWTLNHVINLAKPKNSETRAKVFLCLNKGICSRPIRRRIKQMIASRIDREPMTTCKALISNVIR